MSLKVGNRCYKTTITHFARLIQQHLGVCLQSTTHQTFARLLVKGKAHRPLWKICLFQTIPIKPSKVNQARVFLPVNYFFKKGPNPASFCLFSFFSHDKYSTYTINKKALMACLGLVPGAVGWQAQANPLSYGSTHFYLLYKNCLIAHQHREIIAFLLAIYSMQAPHSFSLKLRRKNLNCTHSCRPPGPGPNDDDVEVRIST